jgi:hypothetical protein
MGAFHASSLDVSDTEKHRHYAPGPVDLAGGVYVQLVLSLRAHSVDSFGPSGSRAGTPTKRCTTAEDRDKSIS